MTLAAETAEFCVLGSGLRVLRAGEAPGFYVKSSAFCGRCPTPPAHQTPPQPAGSMWESTTAMDPAPPHHRPRRGHQPTKNRVLSSEFLVQGSGFPTSPRNWERHSDYSTRCVHGVPKRPLGQGI